MIDKKLLHKNVKQHMFDLYGVVLNEDVVKHRLPFISERTHKWVEVNRTEFNSSITGDNMLVAHISHTILAFIREQEGIASVLYDWMGTHIKLDDSVYNSVIDGNSLLLMVADKDLINVVEVCRMFLTGSRLDVFNEYMYFLVDTKMKKSASDKYLILINEGINEFTSSFNEETIERVVKKSFFKHKTGCLTNVHSCITQIELSAFFTRGVRSDYYGVRDMLLQDPLSMVNARAQSIIELIFDELALIWFRSNYEQYIYKNYNSDKFIVSSITTSDLYRRYIDKLDDITCRKLFFRIYYKQVFDYCDEYIQRSVMTHIKLFEHLTTETIALLITLGIIKVNLNDNFTTLYSYLKNSIFVNRSKYKFVDDIINSLTGNQLKDAVLYCFNMETCFVIPSQLIETICEW